MAEVRERGEHVIRRDLVAREHGLSDRQALVLEVLAGLDAPSLDDLQPALPNIPRRTLQRDLQLLVTKRIVAPEGAARAPRYRLQVKGLR